MTDTKSALSQNYDRTDIIFTIVSKGKGEEIVDLMREKDILINVKCYGRGTATSGILEMLGLGATEKDIVLSFVKNERSADVLNDISAKMNFAKPGKGIAFTVPLQSVAGAKTLKLLTAASLEEV